MAAADVARLRHWLNSQGLECALEDFEQQCHPLSTHASAQPFKVDVDLVALCNADPALGLDVCQHTEAYRQGLLQVLQQEGVLPRGCRLWLRPSSGLLHHDSLGDMQAACTCYGSHTASVCGIVHSLTTPILKPFTQLLICPGCGAKQETLVGHPPSCLACEAGGMADMWTEDLTGRTFVPVQQIWLTSLHSCAVPGDAPYTSSTQTIEINLKDDLCANPLLHLGAPITVVGQVTCCSQPRSQHVALATVCMHALNLLPADAYAHWQPQCLPLGPGPITSHLVPMLQAVSVDGCDVRFRSHSVKSWSPYLCSTSAPDKPGCPLHDMYNELMDAQGCYVGPLLSLAQLISAAMSGTGMQVAQAELATSRAAAAAAGLASATHSHLLDVVTPRGSVSTSTNRLTRRTQAGGVGSSSVGTDGAVSRSISLLVVHGRGDPAAIRTLRASAALLTPVSAAPSGPEQLSDLLLPRLERLKSCMDTATAEGALLVCGSTLTRCNSGVLVLDTPVVMHAGFGGKARAQQLSDVMSSNGQLRLGHAGSHVCVHASATLWCTAEISGTGKLDSALPADRFSLMLMDEVDEDTCTWCTLAAGSDAVSAAGKAQVRGHAQRLRAHMSLVSRMPCQPLITPDAQALLNAYFLSIRSENASAALRPKDVLNTLVGCAMGCARLMLRTQVLPHPDCTLAIALMEETLGLRFASVGWANLDLGPRLSLSGGNCPMLDQQLLLVHQKMVDQLQPYNTHRQLVLGDMGDEVNGPSAMQ